VANEGRLLAFVASNDADRVLAAMRAHESGRESVIIGKVVPEHGGLVVMKTRIGGSRVVDMLSENNCEDLLMSETSNIAVLGLGFILGLKHATIRITLSL